MLHYESTAHLKDGRKIKLVAMRAAQDRDVDVVLASMRNTVIGGMQLETAEHKRGRPGEFLYQPPGAIRRIDVLPEYRRLGVATAMWHCAIAAGFKPRHANEQTTDGKRWADTVGKHAVPLTVSRWTKVKGAWKQSAGRGWDE